MPLGAPRQEMVRCGLRAEGDFVSGVACGDERTEQFVSKMLARMLAGGVQGHVRTGTSVRVTETVIAEAVVVVEKELVVVVVTELEVAAGGLAAG